MKRKPLKKKRSGKRRSGREESPEFLGFVRLFLCATPGCDADSHAHHLKSRGAGGSDFTAVPLCWFHHSEIHQLWRDRFEAKYSVDLGEVNKLILKAWSGQ